MKKQIFNTTVNYKGFGVHDSYCYVKVFEENNKYLVIMTEPNNDEDSGTSVTNACETIATKIFSMGIVGNNPSNIMWVEHYERHSIAIDGKVDCFDRIFFRKFDKKKKVFENPKWIHIGETLNLDILFDAEYEKELKQENINVI